MNTVASTRRKEIARIQRTLERLHSPRLQMMLIVALTASVGFLASFALFHVGVESMWIRYAFAVVIAYVAFLFLLWCWLRLRSSDFLDGLDVPSPSTGGGRGPLPKEAWEPGGGQFGGGGASGSLRKAPTSLDLLPILVRVRPVRVLVFRMLLVALISKN
jgi:uncharacterized membrane protein YgcG